MRKLIYKFTLYAKLLSKKLRRSAPLVIHLRAGDPFPDLFRALYREYGPVIIIKNFIPRESLKDILQYLRERQPQSIETDKFGYCYGQNLMTAKSLADYLQYEKNFNAYLQASGLDYDHYLQQRVQPYSMLPVKRITYQDRPYLPATIRFLQPGQGGIKPHTELLHYELFEPCAHIAREMNLENEISAFCVLQKPESGGKLRIYNCSFNEVQAIPFDDLRYKFMLRSGHNDIDPEEGDLVLFGGGQRWHSITEIGGKIPRISIGNFFCFDKENKNICYWS